MTRRADDSTRVPDLLVERYRFGEMTRDELAAFEIRLAADADLRQRLTALDASDEEIRREYPPAVLAARIRQRLDARALESGRRRSGWMLGLSWKAVAGLATVLLLAVVVTPMLVNPGGDRDLGQGDSDRIKGLDPALLLFRKTADGSEPLADGATARQGDLIRMGYRAAGQLYGMILSIDGRGAVTVHLSRDGAEPARLSSDTQVLLDFAYELDDAPRWERFYFVCGSSPFDLKAVVASASRVASTGANPPTALPLDGSLKQSSLLLLKEAPLAAGRDYRFHVRALDECAAGAVKEARRRSVTVRRLQDALSRSDVVAYIECAWVSENQPQGMLVWMGGTPDVRFVLIRLSVVLAPTRRLELLGHELQHAVEVADATWVSDEPSMGQLFARIGRKTTLRETYETAAAQDAERQVRRDLFAAAPSSPEFVSAPPPGPSSSSERAARPVAELAMAPSSGAPSARHAKR